jgi:Aromatic acid exporter family member 1
MRFDRLQRKARGNLRHFVWWMWPSFPSSWSQVPARLRPATASIARLTAAAVVSYGVASVLFPDIRDLTAPLTALLVVQASTVGTVRTGLVRVGAVLTGVLVAVAVATFLGLTWWSLATVIAASLVLGKVLRLGEQSLEVPISAMVILAVSVPEVAAQVRVANTLIGTLVGIGFSFLVPVAIPNARALDAVRGVARSQAALLDEVALALGSRAPHPEEVQAWFAWTEHIASDIEDAAATVRAAEENRRLNPRALATAIVHPGLQAALERLERCLTAERSLFTVIANEVPGDREAPEGLSGAELRHAFAVVLDDLANGLRAFADLVNAQYGAGTADHVEEALDRMLEIVREARAVLTELMLIDVDPRERADLWVLQGSVLAAVDQVLSQLDGVPNDRPSTRKDRAAAFRGDRSAPSRLRGLLDRAEL